MARAFSRAASPFVATFFPECKHSVPFAISAQCRLETSATHVGLVLLRHQPPQVVALWSIFAPALTVGFAKANRELVGSSTHWNIL